ncbi:4-alpha-glucanotransferase [Actinomycetota bacterium]
MTGLPEPLHRLAEAHGVATDYWGWTGEHVEVAAGTIRTVLRALGVDADTDDAVEAALADVDLAPWRRTLPATVVMREGWTPWVPVHVPHGAGVWLEIVLEDGQRWYANQVDKVVEPRHFDDRLVGEATFELPGNLPLGWHRLVAHVDGAEADPTAEATLIVTPERLELPESMRAGRVWGLMDQVYQARSSRSWGVGDLADLADLADWAGRDLGADFVLVNPLHAAEPIAPMEPSPYLPTTRRFVNPIYLRVEDIPEVAYLPADDRARIEELASAARKLTDLPVIDRDAAWGAKWEALEIVFEAGLTGRRARSFRDYCETEGEGLLTFATWSALAEDYGLPWTEWPEGLQRPDSPAVAAYREEHADRVEFYCWLQWLLDRQLAQVQADALEAGMSLGVVHDLAVGVHPEGADAWGLADALAQGVTVGAPPDQFNQLGQNWSQPPWRPDRLAALGYAPYRDMLRTVLKDSGGIRVDHIIGLFRLWWVPEGHTAKDGTYVRYDHEAFIGILALEAHRAGAVVVGEDLGVVAPNVRSYLAERGVLGTSIMWFEWGEDERPLAPEAYRQLCMTTVTTHDLPPTAGYLTLEHVALRDRLGLLTRPVEEERAAEEAVVGKFRDLLRERGLVDEGADVEETVAAFHRLIAHTPSQMLGVALPDLVGDRRAVNQPGTNNEYPNWRVPLSDKDGRPVLLDDITRSKQARRIAEALSGE